MPSRVTGFAMVAVLAMAAPARAGEDTAAAVEAASATLAPNRFVWRDVATGEPVRVVVNIGEQRAYVYRGTALIAASAVSTGKEGKDTPSGVFWILQKRVDHRSTLYDAAPMPFMQRLTWDGIAIHAGRNPGFPASHGCIRVPLAFARKLYEATTMGTEVTVIGMDGEIDPVPSAAPVDAEAGAIAAADQAAMQ